MSVSDESLVLGARSGDRAAFRALYDRKAKLVLAICHDQTRDIDAAADLMQEVFLRCYANLGQLRDAGQFGPWLIGIARRVCSESRRRETRDQRRVEGLAASRRNVRPYTVQDDAGESIRSAIAELPESERLALHAFYLQEMDVEQARQLLGLSRSGFYHVLATARGRLREVLTQRGAAPDGVPTDSREVLR